MAEKKRTWRHKHDQRDSEEKRRPIEFKAAKRERSDTDVGRNPKEPYSETVNIEIDQEVHNRSVSIAIDERPVGADFGELIAEVHCTAPELYSYDPYGCDVSMIEDTCEKEQLGNVDYDRVYYYENTWEPLEPTLVELGETEEMKRSKVRKQKPNAIRRLSSLS